MAGAMETIEMSLDDREALRARLTHLEQQLGAKYQEFAHLQ